MANLRKIFILSCILFWLSVVQTFAVMRSDFPNANPLQPMPQDTSANVSNNINATSTYEPSSAFPDFSSNTQPQSTTTATSKDKPINQDRPSSAWLWLASIIVIFVGLFFGYRKLK